MPTPLTFSPTLQEAKAWILKNIKGCIIADPNNLIDVPTLKGLYFWFMKPEGSKELNCFVNIFPIETTVEKDGLALVYLGSAGTGKDGNSNLYERIKWHINQKHSKSAICNKYISTLRAGLGSLLSDDLILSPPINTETAINKLLKDYFNVCWIPFPDSKHIDTYEKILIKSIRPLFNIKCNPNRLISNHPTFMYKQRRSRVFHSTRTRLGCKEGIKIISCCHSSFARKRFQKFYNIFKRI